MALCPVTDHPGRRFRPRAQPWPRTAPPGRSAAADGPKHTAANARPRALYGVKNGASKQGVFGRKAITQPLTVIDGHV